MRYFQKLLCLLILVLAASFGVGGCVLLYSDFSVQRSRMAAANAAAHAQACTLLQTEILDLQRRGISTGDAALTARVTAQDVPAALWRGDTLVCATLEGLQSFPLGDAATVTVRTENSIYAVYASDLQGGLRLVTAYDLTGLYRDRNAALMRFLLLEAAVLAAASAVTALLARRLTRPLAVLTDAGAQIAAGDYARRTDLHTGDEIEALSRSFDKMADAVQEKIADLEADVQRREDFVGAFTHELKTPIAVAYAANDALLNFNQAEEKTQRDKYLRICQEQLQRLSGLVEQILSMSMERRKTFRLHPEVLSMADILEPLIEQHKLKSEKPVHILTKIEPAGLTLTADRTHFSNIISNLIDNAIKYSYEEAEISICCRQITSSEQGDCVEISISDRGIGIAPEKQKHIFDKFYRVPTGNLHDVKGYGLGLFYVKTMTEKHGGSVSVKSEPGKGSTFTVRLNK